MAYIPNKADEEGRSNWQVGDRLTPDNLNHIEDGIVDVSAVVDKIPSADEADAGSVIRVDGSGNYILEKAYSADEADAKFASSTEVAAEIHELHDELANEISDLDDRVFGEEGLAVEVREGLDELGGILKDHELNQENPHNVTKYQLGLSNVDNTADIDKPVSTAQSVAINAAKSEEATARQQADEAEAQARVSAINAEAEAREQADAAEATARTNAIAAAKAEAIEAANAHAEEFATEQDLRLKEIIEDQLKDCAFILCETDSEVSNYINKDNLGKYIKFIGENSEQYKFGHYYQVINGRISPNNSWDKRNTTFDAERQQSQSNFTTTISSDVLSKGNIHVEQTADLTSPARNDMTMAVASGSNPKVQSVENGQNDSSHNVFTKFNISKNSLNTINLQSYSTWGVANAYGTSSADYTLEYDTRDADTTGVIYGIAINRDAQPEPQDRPNLLPSTLPTNIRGSHILKINSNAATASIKLYNQLFGYIKCNEYRSGTVALINRWSTRWNGGTTAHGIYGSLWLKYIDSSEVEHTEKVWDSGKYEIPLSSQPSGTTEVDGNGASEKYTIELALPLSTTLDQDGIKEYELIEVLEAYKEQNASIATGIRDSYCDNNVELLAWAAFTDLQVLTVGGAEIEQPYAENPELFFDWSFVNTSVNRNAFKDGDTKSLKGANVAAISMDLTLNSDSDKLIWDGLILASGIVQPTFTINNNRLLLSVLINDESEVVINFLDDNRQPLSNITIDAVQTITARRII